MSKQTGGCQCGAVRFEFTGKPIELAVCHCLECQKQSGSAFGLSLFVSRRRFRVTGGEPMYWSRPADSGAQVTCAFCPRCGSRVWHQNAADSETVSIKAGTLDEPVDVGAATHYWTSRKLPGVVIPEGATQYEREP